MQLKSYTDYSLRVLIYLGLNPQRLVTIAEVAGVFCISRNHLMKVAQQLSASGYIRSVPGKKGGMTLAHPPEAINLGEVVRRMEGNFNVVECFNVDHNTCCIVPACTLKYILREALNRFLENLDRYTLKDLLKNRGSLVDLTASRGSHAGKLSATLSREREK
jgi:Rrf2 family nitric oxide-sensitive transcriptional repressor